MRRQDEQRFLEAMDKTCCLQTEAHDSVYDGKSRGGGWRMDDADYLRVLYRFRFGKDLNLNNPKTFNEKIQWLKLYDHRSLYHTVVDKYEVKKYVSDIIGENYIIPTLGVWDQFDEIDFEKLPERFVLKCTHDSGSFLAVDDKKKLDTCRAKKYFEKWLGQNYFYAGREWAYKDVKPRIIAEKFLEDDEKGDLMDYKIFCFHGHPKMIQVDYDRFSDHKRNLYTTHWKYMEASLHYPTDQSHFIKKPERLEELLELAGKLSRDFLFVRTDFYCLKQGIYFGEMTMYPGDGQEMFQPAELDYKLGQLLDLTQARMGRQRKDKGGSV